MGLRLTRRNLPAYVPNALTIADLRGANRRGDDVQARPILRHLYVNSIPKAVRRRCFTRRAALKSITEHYAQR